MPQYECEKCHKKFDNKTDYTRHVNKKKDCLIKNVIYICNKCNQSFLYKSHYLRHLQSKFSCNGHDKLITIDNTIQNIELKKYQCNNCSKWYTTKKALTRHLNEFCKLSENNKNNTTTDVINNLKKEIENKDKIINNINNGTVNNTINNGTVNNTINNTNITINAYGKEDLSHITDKDYKNIFNKCNSAIPMLIELIHYNEEKPENTNVYISNMKSQYAYVYDGKKWILKNKSELIDDIYDNKCIILLEKYDDLKNILNDKTIKNFEHFKNKYDMENMKENVSNRIELVLYNNRNLIKK
jgi:uncharacterized C2H2 Zn-finger protein